MKIVTFNANGIRARLPIVLEWLDKELPDVLCLQETKVQDVDFPRKAFENLGYHCVFRGQKAYNGVGMVSRKAPDNVCFGFGDGDAAEEPRLVTAAIDGIAIVNTLPILLFLSSADKISHLFKCLGHGIDIFNTC